MKSIFVLCLAAVLLPSCANPKASSESPEGGATTVDQGIGGDVTTGGDNGEKAEFSDRNILVFVYERDGSVEYGVESFPELDLASVRVVAPYTGGEMIIDGEKCVLLCLELAEPGQDKVHEGIEMLEKREDVHSAHLDYIYHLIDWRTAG